MYIIPPKEDTTCPEGVAKLNKAMYGLRDAGQCFDAFIEGAMTKIQFKAGQFSTCVYCNDGSIPRLVDGEKHGPLVACKDGSATTLLRAARKKKSQLCVRHGDDFIVLGTRAEQAAFLKDMNEKLNIILKHVGTLGPDPQKGDVPEVRCLNRLLRFVNGPGGDEKKSSIEWEADPRHMEILLQTFGWTPKGKGITSPGVKDSAATASRADQAMGSQDSKSKPARLLSKDEISLFRSAAMRYNYLSHDLSLIHI